MQGTHHAQLRDLWGKALTVTLRVLRSLFHPPWKGGPGWKKVAMGSACQGLNLPSSFMQEGFPSKGVCAPFLPLPSLLSRVSAQPCCGPRPDEVPCTYATSSYRTLSMEESKTRRSFTGVNPEQIWYLDQKALTEKGNAFNLSSRNRMKRHV